MRKSVFMLIRWSLVVGAVFLVQGLKTPVLFPIREMEFLLVAVSGLGVVPVLMHLRRNQRKRGHGASEPTICLLALLTVLGWATVKEAIFYDQKEHVLNTPKARLQQLGRHFVVGYTDAGQLETLIARGAVGGVYITGRNVAGRSADDIKALIRQWQTIRMTSGLPPLIVATDQEGGVVSRLSPMIPWQPALATLVRQAKNMKDLDRKVAAYSGIQARALSGLGVNVNLSPVVDLKPKTGAVPDHPRTRLHRRTMSGVPFLVARVGLGYCRRLEAHGVVGTLKHFPGLGDVAQDTHLDTGGLSKPADRLETEDWLPFREISRQTSAWIMLGHVRLTAVDPLMPASISQRVVREIIRKDWKHEGILITDDLNMGAVYRLEGGIRTASVSALNAGVDLLLISYDPDQYFPAMHAVLEAEAAGQLDPEVLEQSRQRLRRFYRLQGEFRPGATSSAALLPAAHGSP